AASAPASRPPTSCSPSAWWRACSPAPTRRRGSTPPSTRGRCSCTACTSEPGALTPGRHRRDPCADDERDQMSITTDAPVRTTEQFAERLFGAALGAIDLLAIHLGDRMGWYRALAEHGPADAATLTAHAGGDARYATEWLEQQAASDILRYEGEGRFSIPEAVAEVLLDHSSTDYLAPLARMIAAAAVQTPALLEAYRTGGGVGWDRYGADMRESQSDMNRPWFERRLAAALAGVPEVRDALAAPGARVADIGCGGGWSSIALAKAYPSLTVDGYDIDAPS